MPPGRTIHGQQIRYLPKPPWAPPAPHGTGPPMAPVLPTGGATAPDAATMDAQENPLLLAKAALAQIKALRAELVAVGLLPEEEAT